MLGGKIGWISHRSPTWNFGARSGRPPGAVLGADGRPDSLEAAARTHPSLYPKAGKGRRPYPLAVMLRIHCVQLFYNLSDPGMEDLLYETESVRRFVGLNLSEALPDETTILNFRHLLERQGLGQSLFEWCFAHVRRLVRACLVRRSG